MNAPSATVWLGEEIGGGAAFTEPLPESEVARTRRRAGQHQVAEARKAGQRLAARAAGEAEAGHLSEAARDQGGAGVLAQAFAFDDAAGDGETFFTAPPISAPTTSSDR